MGAYACEPHMGSEPEVGLAWARAAAIGYDVTVLTRANNLEALLPYGSPSLTFVGFDLPTPVLFFKKYLGSQLYYILWQWRAGVVARKLHSETPFDIAHHITFASDCLPAGVLGISAPTRVWGPVGGRAPWPPDAVKWLGVRGTFGELRRQLATGILRATTGRRTARRSTAILAQNYEVLARLPRSKSSLCPNVVVPGRFGMSAHREPAARSVVAVGRLEPLKALRLTMAAIAELKSRGQRWKLLLIGEGVQRDALRAYAKRLNILEQVSFVGRLPRDEVGTLMGEATVFASSCMREAAGFAVAEAVTLGVPVVYADTGGPSVIARKGAGVPVALGPRMAERFADAIASAGQMTDRQSSSAWGSERLVAVLDRVYSGEPSRDGSGDADY